MSSSMPTTRRRRKPAHRAKTPSLMRLTSIGGLLISTAIIGGGAFLGLSSVDGTYAMWNNSAGFGGPSIDSGSMTVEAGWDASSNWSTPSSPFVIPLSAVGDLFPGDSVQDDFQIRTASAGENLSSDISIHTAASVPAPFQLHVKDSACASPDPFIATEIGTTPIPLGNWGVGSTNTKTICLKLSVPSDASLTFANNPASTGLVEFIVTATQKQPSP